MLGNLLVSIDLFGIPIAMNHFGRDKLKSNFGGICSVLFFGFLVWATYNSADDLFSKSNPKVVIQETAVDDPRTMILNHQNFPLAFSLNGGLGAGYKPFVNERIFTVTAEQQLQHIIKYANGSTKRTFTYTEIDVEPCSQDYFDGYYAGINLGNAYCISKNQTKLDNIEIQGEPTSTYAKQVNAYLRRCVNTTENGNHCLTDAEIDRWTAGGWFNAVYLDTVVRSQNYTHPNYKYRDMFYTMVNPKDYHEIEIQLGYLQVDTDSGWIVPDIHSQNFLKVEKIIPGSQSEPNADGIFLTLIFSASKVETYYTRSYVKIQGILAEVGSLAKVFLIVALLLTHPYFKLKFRESLVNELFDIKTSEKPGKKKGKKDQPNQTNSKGEKKNKGKVIQQTTSKSEPDDTNGDDRQNKVLGRLKSKMKKTVETYQENKTQEGFNTKETARPLTTEMARFRPLSELTEKESPPTSPKVINSSRLFVPDVKRQETGQVIRESMSIKNDTKREGLSINVNTSSQRGERLLSLQSPSSALRISGNLHNSVQPEEKVLEEDMPEHLSFSSVTQNNMEQDINREDIDVLSQGRADEEDGNILAEVRKMGSNIKADMESENKDVGLHVSEIPEEEDEMPNEEESEKSDEIKTFANTGSDKLNLKPWEYYMSFFWKPPIIKEKFELLDKGLKSISERLDVVNIQKKLRDVDKLRALLLTADQLTLFDNLPKPQIRPPSEADAYINKSFSRTRLKTLKFVREYATKEELVEAYKNIKRKKDKTELDRKLLEIYKESIHSTIL